MKYPAICCLALVLSACGDRSQPAVQAPAQPAAPTTTWRRPWSDDDIQKPAWIADPTRGGTVVAAWGSTPHDPYVARTDMRDKAMDSARRELARMVAVKVQAVMKDFLSESQSGGTGSVTKLSEQIGRTIAVQNIKGSVQRDEWTHPKTGELFVWVVVDAKYQERMAQEVAKAARAAVAQDPAADAHLRAKLESDKAFAEMDRLLDAQFQGKK